MCSTAMLLSSHCGYTHRSAQRVKKNHQKMEDELIKSIKLYEIG